MRASNSQTGVATLLALSHLTQAVHLHQVVEYPVKRVAGSSENAVSVSINNEQWLYTVEISIGTPPQKTLVQVDTGSAYLWVNANCTAAPTEFGGQELCKTVPLYDPEDSSSAEGPIGSRTLGYGSGDVVNGAIVDMYEDVVRVGNATVKTQKFGVASNSRGLPIGIMGLAPPLNGTFGKQEPYSLFLDSMARDSVIASRAFGVSLGGASDSEGSLIFGGLDRGKFSGSLKKTSIVESRDNGTRFTINLSSIGADAGNSTKKQYSIKDTNVLLDTGHTATRLNKDLAEQIHADLGAELNEELGVYLVDCKVRDHAGGITFGFGGSDDEKIITVPFHELIYTSQGLCAVAVEPTKEGEQQILGDSFLRAAYVVFDWDNKNVHIAQAANCGSDIVDITSGPNAVPSVSGKCSSNSTTTGLSPAPTGQVSSAGQLQTQLLGLFAVVLTGFVLTMV
ncbi:hypothetical protein NM208_g6391 [Fusarium decemcellulare]|uniref:Uncharacterized protein n=1 Tax=Fusarium decemcellulare TaxID=57161 RepID=A0ACC1SD54_9HYPO|nr:hypothetical protein NM208_g6391 [Fusarium decemcellulare]